MKKALALLIFLIVLTVGVLTGCVDDATGEEHNYIPTVIEPTCDSAGYITWILNSGGSCRYA